MIEEEINQNMDGSVLILWMWGTEETSKGKWERTKMERKW